MKYSNYNIVRPLDQWSIYGSFANDNSIPENHNYEVITGEKKKILQLIEINNEKQLDSMLSQIQMFEKVLKYQPMYLPLIEQHFIEKQQLHCLFEHFEDYTSLFKSRKERFPENTIWRVLIQLTRLVKYGFKKSKVECRNLFITNKNLLLKNDGTLIKLMANEFWNNNLSDSKNFKNEEQDVHKILKVSQKLV